MIMSRLQIDVGYLQETIIRPQMLEQLKDKKKRRPYIMFTSTKEIDKHSRYLLVTRVETITTDNPTNSKSPLCCSIMT